MNKKALFLACVMALSLCFTACSDNEKKTESTTTEATEASTTTNAPQLIISDVSTTLNVTENKPVIPDDAVFAEYDTQFEISLDQKVYFGDGNVYVELRSIQTDSRPEIDYYSTSVLYTLCIDGEEIDGLITIDDTEAAPYNAYQDYYTPQRLMCYEAGQTSATLLLTEETVAKEPVTLSGNADEWYTAPEHVYLEDDNMVVFIYDGVTVPCNLLDKIYNYIDIVEEKSGFEFDNDTKFAAAKHTDHSWLFDETFAGVDPFAEKFTVYIAPHNESISSAFNSYILINPTIDNILDDSCALDFVHELSHVYHLRNGVDMGRIMTEGYATYMADVILTEHPELLCESHADESYRLVGVDVTKDNAKELFLESFSFDYDNYCYGYNLMHFLFETYGDSIFRDILKSACENIGEYDYEISTSAACEAIIKNTSETVFEDFADWLLQNGNI